MTLKRMDLRKVLCLVLALALMTPAQALFAASRESFNKAVKELQADPSNKALRKKIFAMAREMSTPPEAPDEVAILKGKAAYIIKTAGSTADYHPAVEAYEKAVNLAPWVPDLYYNLGVVQEKAGMPAEAIASFKLYLAADPDAEDREKVLARLGGLEVQMEKQVQGGGRVQQAGNGRPADSEALRRWQGKKGGQIAVGVVSGVTLGMGAIFLGIGMGETSSALYTTSPGYSKGVLYNKYYEGKYWSTASYNQYTEGQTLTAVGWGFLGVGCLGLIITVAMDPGRRPTTALLDLQDGKLAMGLPVVSPHLDGMQMSLLHAQF